MYSKLADTISIIHKMDINPGRSSILQPLIDYIQIQLQEGQTVNINFICTHNSRRSHLSQVWAQIAAAYYRIANVYCYSGGTEETALFPKVVETLCDAGIEIQPLSAGNNPIYSIKYDENSLPIIGFSKLYDDVYNPQSAFVAVLTCSQADEGCPFIAGAKKRIPITYEDPKISDGTEQQMTIYKNRSLEIASEMFYIFSKIK